MEYKTTYNNPMTIWFYKDNVIYLIIREKETGKTLMDITWPYDTFMKEMESLKFQVNRENENDWERISWNIYRMVRR